MKHYNISRFLSALMISALLMGQTVYAGDTAFKTYDGFLPSGGASTTDLYEDETGKKETGETTTRPGEAESEEESETKRQTESESVTDSESESESESETETEIVIDPEEEPEEPEEIIIVPEFLTQAEFEAVSERIRIATDVPIEGLPSYITQEMVSAALETAEETGCPASVTLAQLILESENEEGSGMRSMAATYCNLFGIHGLGSNGYAGGAGISVADSYNAFPKNASYAAYYTYTEAYHARNEILKGQVYQEISAADVRDYAVYFGRQWSGSSNYGFELRKIIETYELDRVDELTLSSFSDMIGVIANPCPGSHISSTYGYREWDHKNHLGIDLATNSQHIPTYAALAGKVIFVGYGTSTGNMIVIDHGNGMLTKYMHHSEMYVEVGDLVFKGQQIGLAGTTGRSTGIHLHFQIEQGGSTVDPLIYFSKMGSTDSIPLRAEAERETILPEQLPVTADFSEIRKMGL